MLKYSSHGVTITKLNTKHFEIDFKLIMPVNLFLLLCQVIRTLDNMIIWTKRVTFFGLTWNILNSRYFSNFIQWSTY